MSSEITAYAIVKLMGGAVLACAAAAWSWIAKDHSDRLKENEKHLSELNDKLNTEYHNKEAVEKHIELVMAPIQQRLDTLNQTMLQVVDELRKLNDRVIRVETKQR